MQCDGMCGYVRDRASIMVCQISIGCVTSYGNKNSNLTSFSDHRMLTSMLLGHDRKNTFLNVDTKAIREVGR